jgi:hypothetical protein
MKKIERLKGKERKEMRQLRCSKGKRQTSRVGKSQGRERK